MLTPPDFDLHRVQSALRHAAVGHTLDYHEVTSSTMALARTLAQNPQSPSGAVVVADVQTAGRGRLRRTWQAPAGKALLFSVLLKAEHLPRLAGHLPMIAGLAVRQAIAPLLEGFAHVGLKWPNDVVTSPMGSDPSDGDLSKVAGILVESALAGDRLNWAVVGIGVNVNQAAHEFPLVEPPALTPVSMASLLGRPVDRSDLFIAIAREFADALRLPGDALVATWKQNLWTLGRRVTAFPGDDAELTGVAVDVTESGGLVIESGAGRQIVDAGDVSLRRGHQDFTQYDG